MLNAFLSRNGCLLQVPPTDLPGQLSEALWIDLVDTSDAERAWVESLLPQSTFLFDQVNFLVGAAKGFINIRQNQIIKIFSVLAVIFLPPTLIASSYGMNIERMPELSWPFEHPLPLVLMAVSAIAPHRYFKRKGWL